MMASTSPRNEILVGIDGTEQSHAALHLGRRLAEATGARLVLVRAFPADPINNTAGSDHWNAMLEAESRRQLEEAQSVLGGDMTAEHVVVPLRSGARALHALAEERGAAMVVVGSTHTGRIGRILPGATAERLLHGSPCPVAVAPHGDGSAGERPSTIGVAWDGSPESDAALAFAATLAAAFGCGLRVLRAFETTGPLDPTGLAGVSYPEIVEELRASAQEALTRAAARVPASIDREARLLDGAPIPTLVEQTETLDLLVCGSRGYGPLRAVLLGGVTGPVLRQAACPVVVVPRGSQAPAGGAGTADAR